MYMFDAIIFLFARPNSKTFLGYCLDEFYIILMFNHKMVSNTV